MNGNYGSMRSMMGNAPFVASVPAQNFSASNIIGTPLPKVGDNKGIVNYAGAVGTNINKMQVVLIAVAIVGIGYLLHHFTFEK